MPEGLPYSVLEVVLSVLVFLLGGVSAVLYVLLRADRAEMKRKDIAVTGKVVELAERLSYQDGYRAGRASVDGRRES